MIFLTFILFPNIKFAIVHKGNFEAGDGVRMGGWGENGGLAKTCDPAVWKKTDKECVFGDGVGELVYIWKEGGELFEDTGGENT